MYKGHFVIIFQVPKFRSFGSWNSGLGSNVEMQVLIALVHRESYIRTSATWLEIGYCIIIYVVLIIFWEICCMMKWLVWRKFWFQIVYESFIEINKWLFKKCLNWFIIICPIKSELKNRFINAYTGQVLREQNVNVNVHQRVSIIHFWIIPNFADFRRYPE